MSRFPNNFQSPNGHFRPGFQKNLGPFQPPPWAFSGPGFSPDFCPPRHGFQHQPHDPRMAFGCSAPRPHYRGGGPGRFAGNRPPGPRPPFMNGNNFGPQNYGRRAPNPAQSHEPGTFHGHTTHNNNRRGQGQRKEGNKKKKKSKAQEEVNYSHYCDICDRGFKADEQLKAHLAEHVKCQEKDCKFVGHPKIVAVHRKLQHGPGAKKIASLETKEEIEKWRNERKRNFPSAANVAQKNKEQEKREAQGNVLETKQFGKMKNQRGRGRDRGRGRGRGRGGWNNRGHARHAGIGYDESPVNEHHSPAKRRKVEGGDQKPDVVNTTTKTPTRVLPPDCDPLSILAGDGNESDEGDVNASKPVPKIEVAPRGSFGALGSLAACYDSDSEGNDPAGSSAENPPNTEKNLAESSLTSGKGEPPISNESSGHRRYQGEDGDGSHDSNVRTFGDGGEGGSRGGHWRGRGRGRGGEGNRKWRKTHRGKRGQGSKERCRKRYEMKKRKATLLEMLLAPDIRKERNILLQCVRHVIGQGFYQDSSSSTAST